MKKTPSFVEFQTLYPGCPKKFLIELNLPAAIRDTLYKIYTELIYAEVPDLYNAQKNIWLMG